MGMKDAADIAVEENLMPEQPKQGFFKRLSKKQIVMISIIAGVLIFAGIAAVLIFRFSQRVEEQLNVNTFYNGIMIEGLEVGGKTKEEAKSVLEEVLPGLREEIALTVSIGDKNYQYDKDDFQFDYDVDAVIDEAYQTARDGNLWSRYMVYRKLPENPVNFEITASLSGVDEKLKGIAAGVAEENNRDAKEPELEQFDTSKSSIEEMFTFTEAVNGLKVNEEQIYQDCKSVMEQESKSGTVTVQTEEIPTTKTVEEMMSHITEFPTYTTVSSNTANGNHNMSLALSKVNGTVLQPGDVFSYNETVGKRTTKNGFRAANVISEGEYVEGIGGGICQASTTIYGAVLRSGLEIVERSSHSIPSSYEKIGQDAMVSWGSSDLKFKNNTEYPVYIKAHMSGKTLYVTIYGDQPEEWDTIEIGSKKTETIPAGGAKYEDDDSLPKGETKVKTNGRDGARAVAWRTFYKDGKQVKNENLPSSYYRPSNAVILRGTKEVYEPVNEANTEPADDDE